MLEIATDELKTLSIDHHGLVAAVCQDLKISEKIDQKLGVDKQRKVSPGQAVKAMILNGLGFTNRRLYLTHQFFKNKPVNTLLENNAITSEDLTDYTLGHTLDEIFKYGTSKLFGEIAFSIAIENNLLGNMNHLDTTSISVEGEYKTTDTESVNDIEPKAIKLTHGHSKDHRQDLKQAVLSLVVNGPSSIPIWMDPLDGNNSDKNSFHETIKKVQDFQKQINVEKNFKWVADSALYSKDKLLNNNNYIWLTRVPETIKEVKLLLDKTEQEINWELKDNGYKIASFKSNYGDLEQRWLLVYSEQAYKREAATLEKNIQKKEKTLISSVKNLNKKTFENENEIIMALRNLEKNNKFFDFSYKINEKFKYAKSGKPKINSQKISEGYKVELNFSRNISLIEKTLNRKGKFILATNDLDADNYPNENMLMEYKEQQKVEGGFRFLKDPWFMVDSIFLKLPSRIEALMMVMTLCLMVYNVAQYKLRKTLQENDETLPNQINKKIKNPTLKWIFQIMEGINIVQFYKKHIKKPIKEIITNLDNLRIKIIKLFGVNACQMYGLT